MLSNFKSPTKKAIQLINQFHSIIQINQIHFSILSSSNLSFSCRTSRCRASSLYFNLSRKNQLLKLNFLKANQLTSSATIMATCTYFTEERGRENTLDYRIYFRDAKGPISPFHDIQLRAGGGDNNLFNMVVEIPRWSNAKMEISTKEPLNPIKQDVKKDKLRFVANCFPHHGYIWNYGALPQTWENPNAIDENTKCKGDNDPIDVCEIGSRIHKRGAVVKVKVLGVFGLIDEGETDWKILAIDITDPLADKLKDIEDIERFMPGYLRATVEWFRIYKIPDGKGENKFAFNGEAKNAAFALNLIEETHKYWQKLLNKEIPNDELSLDTVTDSNSPFALTVEAANEIINKNPPAGCPATRDPFIDKWHYITVNPN